MGTLKPPWSVTYILKGTDPEGMLSGWKWEGHIEWKGLSLLGRSDAETDPTVLGTATVTSQHEEQRQAEREAWRRVLDVTGVLGAAIGGLSVIPLLPPRVVAGDGTEAPSLHFMQSSGVSIGLTQHLTAKKDTWFKGLEQLDGNPPLRAIIDTFDLAKASASSTVEVLHNARIYDSYVTDVLRGLGGLLSKGQRRKVVTAAMHALQEFEPSPTDRDRVRNALGNALGRVFVVSKVDALEEHFSQEAFADLGLDRPTLELLDKARGLAAHEPDAHDLTHADVEIARGTLARVAHRIVQVQLGLKPLLADPRDSTNHQPTS